MSLNLSWFISTLISINLLLTLIIKLYNLTIYFFILIDFYYQIFDIIFFLNHHFLILIILVIYGNFNHNRAKFLLHILFTNLNIMELVNN